MSLNHIPLSLSITPPCTLDKNPQYRISNVVLALPMDELCPNDPVKDYSGNGNHGTATGTQIVPHPLFAGKQARKFDGTSDMISIPNFTLTPPFTICFTLQRLEAIVPNWRMLIDHGCVDYVGWGIGTGMEGRLMLYGGDGSNAFVAQLGGSLGATPLGVAVRFAVTFLNATQAKIWCNGIELGIITLPVGGVFTFDNTHSYRIGRRPYQGGISAVISDVFFISGEVDANASRIDVYADPTLEAGKVYVRGRVADGNGLNKCIDKLKSD